MTEDFRTEQLNVSFSLKQKQYCYFCCNSCSFCFRCVLFCDVVSYHPNTFGCLRRIVPWLWHFLGFSICILCWDLLKINMCILRLYPRSTPLSELIQQTTNLYFSTEKTRFDILCKLLLYLYWRQFAWNFKTLFLGKIRKLFQYVVCRKFYTGC